MGLAFQDSEDFRNIVDVVQINLSDVNRFRSKRLSRFRLGVQFLQPSPQRIVDKLFQAYVPTSPQSLKLYRNIVVDCQRRPHTPRHNVIDVMMSSESIARDL